MVPPSIGPKQSLARDPKEEDSQIRAPFMLAEVVPIPDEDDDEDDPMDDEPPEDPEPAPTKAATTKSCQVRFSKTNNTFHLLLLVFKGLLWVCWLIALNSATWFPSSWQKCFIHWISIRVSTKMK